MTLIFLSNLVQLRADPENESEALERGREKREERYIYGGNKGASSPRLSARPEVFIILGVTDTLTRLSQITDKLRN